VLRAHGLDPERSVEVLHVALEDELDAEDEADRAGLN
jgi:hypothetical protein